MKSRSSSTTAAKQHTHIADFSGSASPELPQDFEERAALENPMQITCEGCGAPAEFSIINQNYHCAFCGADTRLDAPAEKVRRFRRLQAESLKKDQGRSSLNKFSCPNCGAVVVQDITEATSSCEFCGAQLVNSAFTDSDSFPEAIIPFKITLDEAKVQLEEWAASQKMKKEAKLLKENIQNLHGYYLPYQMVKGPVACTVLHGKVSRKYSCGGFIDEVAVNTSVQLDNLLLEAMEPFDWRELRPFSYGLIAGHHTKLNELNQKALESRIEEELKESYYPSICRTMHTKDVIVRVNASDTMQIPALMPVYILKAGNLQAAVNGQTGRVSVKPLREKTVFRWWVEPLLTTLAVFALCEAALWYFVGKPFFSFEYLELSGMITVVAGVIAFAASEGQETVKKILYLQSKKQLLKRHSGKLLHGDPKELRDNPTLEPVFFERVGNSVVPVKIRFLNTARILKGMTAAFFITCLPCITSVMLVGYDILFYDDPVEFLYEINFRYAAAWWTLFVPILFILWLTVVRRDLFAYPLLYLIGKEGQTSLVRGMYGISWRKIFGICRVTPINWALMFVFFMAMVCSFAMTDF